MTTATATTWPTEESLAPAQEALVEAYNATERVSMSLNPPLQAYADRGTFPEPLPTLETVGALWSFLDLLRTEIAQLTEIADDLERDLRELDHLRLNAIVTSRKAGSDA